MPKVRRPFWYKVLVAGCLVIAWFGFLRLYSAFANWDLLTGYMTASLLTYIAVSGAVWGLAGLVCAVTLWTGMQFAPTYVRLLAASCFIWYWMDRILISRSSGTQGNLVFALITSILILLFALLVPSLPNVVKFLASRRK